MTQPQKSGHVYLIINNKLPLAWDLFSLEENLVGGTPPKREESQRVRSTVIDDPHVSPLFLSNLGSASLQWIFEREGEYLRTNQTQPGLVW